MQERLESCQYRGCNTGGIERESPLNAHGRRAPIKLTDSQSECHAEQGDCRRMEEIRQRRRLSGILDGRSNSRPGGEGGKQPYASECWPPVCYGAYTDGQNREAEQ